MSPGLDQDCFQISTFTCFLLSSADFFSNNDFRKFIPYLMVWIQIRTNELHIGPDPRPNCLEKISADYKSRPLFFILMIFKVCFYSLFVLLCKKPYP